MAHPDDAAFHLMRRVLQDQGVLWQARIPELTRPQFAALSVLAADPDIDQATLGARAGIDKATMAGMIRRLEERGLISRTIAADDRRRYQLRLTQQGRRAVKATTPLADKVDTEALAPLSATEQQHLLRLLRKLATAATPDRDLRPR